MDDRGVSAVLGYVMVLGIVTLLISGLFFAAGNFVENQHERAVRSEFEVVGNRLAADIAAMDRLALAAESGEADLLTNLPRRAAGQPYRITISQVAGTTDQYHINLTVTGLDVETNVRVKAETPIVEGVVGSGDVRIVYNGTHLEVHDV